MIPLLQAVKQVQEFLEHEGWSFMVVGGLAVAVWGRVRATLDVDISVAVHPHDRQRLVDSTRQYFTPVPDDPEKFIARTNILPIVTESDIPVDLICAWTEMEEEAIRRARSVEVEPGFTMRVATPEDLLLMKFISERPRDREDVEGILIRNGASMEHDYVRKWLRVLTESLNLPSLADEYEEYLRWTSPEQ